MYPYIFVHGWWLTDLYTLGIAVRGCHMRQIAYDWNLPCRQQNKTWCWSNKTIRSIPQWSSLNAMKNVRLLIKRIFVPFRKWLVHYIVVWYSFHIFNKSISYAWTYRNVYLYATMRYCCNVHKHTQGDKHFMSTKLLCTHICGLLLDDRGLAMVDILGPPFTNMV